MTTRPPKRSVQMPSGKRSTAPSSTGAAVSRPNSVLLSCSARRMGMPITPNIIQTAKQTMKAKVLARRTAYAFGCACVDISSTAESDKLADHAARQEHERAHQKPERRQNGKRGQRKRAGRYIA